MPKASTIPQSSELATDELGFLPVRLTALRLLGGLDRDLYVLNEGSPEPVLLSSQDYALDDRELLGDLEQKGVRKLYIKLSDSHYYEKKLEENLDELLAHDDVDAAERCGILQSAVAIKIEHAFRLVHCDQAVKESRTIGRQIAELLIGSQALPSTLFEVLRHDTYAFTHVTNVASYAVLLAERLGIHDPQELEAIAVGGLLHDLGKRLIPSTLLNKQGPLTHEEMLIVKKHPQTGYEELHTRTDLCLGQLMMVYQHHERIDGTGYPVRITGEEIHPWAQLCAVVDVFDAMACKRPYRERIPLEDVIKHLRNVAGIHLDKEMVECWTSTMSDR